jgi:hypothetical protein
MSLDVYLTTTRIFNNLIDPPIYIIQNSEVEQIPREAWDQLFPGEEPATLKVIDYIYHYEANITHNLNFMAEEVGIYKELWRPDEINITKAHQLIEPLQAGLDKLKTDPERCKKFNPRNGWGDYDGLVSFVTRYLEACKQYPDADVTVSR